MQTARRKVMVVFGTRPEASKMCPVIKELQTYTNYFDTKIVVTGQHREQLDQVLEVFDLQPDFDLNIMKANQSLAYVTSAALEGLDGILDKEKPDLILVHGDTQTAMVGAMAGYFHKIPVGHVEAGLRSHDKYSPWPEEMNRKIVDTVSDLLFAPTSLGKTNLLHEGYQEEQIFITGQTAVDAALQTHKEEYAFKESKLNAVDFNHSTVITVTAHRRENYGKPMEQMFQAIRQIADSHERVQIVYPVHKSPVVQEHAASILAGHDRIMLLDPLGYSDMINLLSCSSFILSDSGGLQEEAAVFNKPLLLMRDTTERQEAVDAGGVVLAGTNKEVIVGLANKLLLDEEFYQQMASSKNPFGDGKASQRIVQIIRHHFGLVDELPEELL
ncbi:non-hydrolyzing UDP-N-acetylglucosamine 2-epimerase [Paenibacillus aquistagni]|uniref:non-hydrolyzing UDP-N-acetylglucosamine 2-epimerase n=1 Tax=Paenibacillus aquistagni TaxID=1852522 RepID=UPI00145A7C34|nr:UDP-N-acetylglucosamine 2-epimerase (non-hydrolyzing) [Paenibacillus aquistagni]NMM52859.1 UDP-N-acetylglucosamine 2-epimerase (non-hydrolyzing) [Paenibacillus aquistagni]